MVRFSTLRFLCSKITEISAFWDWKKEQNCRQWGQPHIKRPEKVASDHRTGESGFQAQLSKPKALYDSACFLHRARVPQPWFCGFDRQMGLRIIKNWWCGTPPQKIKAYLKYHYQKSHNVNLNMNLNVTVRCRKILTDRNLTSNAISNGL